MKIFKILIVIILFVTIGFRGYSNKNENEAREEVETTRPNIILMLNDDMGYECLSCNGSVSYKTPVLDKMAKNGIRFTQCYSQPLCTPSRVKIMTGKYNSSNYIDFGFLDPSQKTFGNVMKEAGYKTMIAGKWQLNGVETKEPGYNDINRPYEFGFDEYCLWWLTSKGSRYANPRLVANTKPLKTTIDDYGPDIVSNYVIDFMERKRDKPFFIYYPMLLVHAPFQPTPDSPEWESPERRSEKDSKYFKDMVEYSDKIAGKIIQKLNELGLADKTILIFSGDNGTNTDITTQTQDGPYPGGKGHLQDNGTHVPLIIRWPQGGIKNQVSNDLVEFSDFLPTFADAAGVSAPKDVVGKSFFNLIAGQKYTPRSTVSVHYYAHPQKVNANNGCFIRTVDYKLYSDGRFFDMKNDKWEKSPLNMNALTGEQKSVCQLLKNKLDKKEIWDFSKPHRISNR